LIRGDYVIYFKVYWITEGVYAIATLLVLHEAFRWVFLDFYEFWWFWFLFPGVTAIIVTFATVHALRHPPAHVPTIVGVILSLGISIIYVKVGIFALFLIFVLLFTLQWHSYPFGIMLGFAISAIGSAFAYGLFYDFGTKFNFVSKYAVSVSYICGVAFWLDTFRRQPNPEAIRGWPASMSPEELLQEGQSYVRFLKDWGKKNDP
jgi:hypothetical protein